jgi:hypothetical protein
MRRWRQPQAELLDSATPPISASLAQNRGQREGWKLLKDRTVFKNEHGRQLLSVMFEAEDQRYTWLNHSFCVLEGVIGSGGMRAQVYACINELIDQP